MLTLREWRRVKEITQVQMAAAIGVHVNTYQLWEKEPAKIPIGMAIEIADVIGVPFETINFLGTNHTKTEEYTKLVV